MSENEKKPATLDEAVARIEGDDYSEVALSRRVELIEAYLGGTVWKDLNDVDFLRKDYRVIGNDLQEMKERLDLFEKKLESHELKQNYMFSLIGCTEVEESNGRRDTLRLAERVGKIEAKLVDMEADIKRAAE